MILEKNEKATLNINMPYSSNIHAFCILGSELTAICSTNLMLFVVVKVSTDLKLINDDIINNCFELFRIRLYPRAYILDNLAA